MKHRYDKQGILALEPKAFFDYFIDPPDRDSEAVGDVAVVKVVGPLEHHGGWWCDSYDAILDRVDAACTGPAHTIVLKITSPGGEVSGMLETARVLRARCDLAGKRLVAFVAGQCCSAAYALACAAERIVVSEESVVGSIGIICTRSDLSEAHKMWGVKVAVIASSERKADGHPDTPISEAELVETQRVVDELAGVFFELVGEMRGKPAEAFSALNARVFIGADAVDVGLADAVQTFDQLLAALASPEEDTMASKYEEGRAALEEAAKGDGEEAEKAKKALAAMDEDKPEGEGDDPPADDKPEGEGDDPPADDKEKDDEPASARTVGSRLAKIERELEASKVRDLLATRPDLDRGVAALLAKKPLAQVQEFISAMGPAKPPAAATPPAVRGPGQAQKPAASAVVAGTRGPGQIEIGGTARFVESDDVMDQAMGLAEFALGVRRDGNSQVFGVMSKAEADSAAAERASRRAAVDAELARANANGGAR